MIISPPTSPAVSIPPNAPASMTTSMAARLLDAFTEGRDADRGVSRALSGLAPGEGFRGRLLAGFRAKPSSAPAASSSAAPATPPPPASPSPPPASSANYVMHQSRFNNPLTQIGRRRRRRRLARSSPTPWPIRSKTPTPKPRKLEHNKNKIRNGKTDEVRLQRRPARHRPERDRRHPTASSW